MKKKLLLLVLPALMAMSSCTYLESGTVQKNDFLKEDNLAHEEIFGEPGKLLPKQLGEPEDDPAGSDPSWTKMPKVGVQFKSYVKDVNDDPEIVDNQKFYAVRYVAAIAGLEEGVTAEWTRGVSEKSSNQIKAMSGEFYSTAEYDSLNNGGTPKSASSEGSGYNKYVVYTLYDIPEDQNNSYVLAYLTLSKAGETPVKSKAVAIQANGENAFSFSADKAQGFFLNIKRGETHYLVDMDDTPSGTDAAKKTDLELSANDEFEYFYYNPGLNFQCFGYETFNREYYYFEKSSTSNYYKIRVNGTYTLTPNVDKLLYGTCSSANVTLYLNPNTQWIEGNAKFSVHYNDDDSFHPMSEIGDSGIYKLDNYDFKAHPLIIFVRHNSSGVYTWDTKWNQTSDIRFDGAQDGKETGNDNPSKSMYTVNTSSGDWNYTGGTWSVYSA